MTPYNTVFLSLSRGVLYPYILPKTIKAPLTVPHTSLSLPMPPPKEEDRERMVEKDSSGKKSL